MPRVQVSTGIELEYATAGDPADTPLLMVNGFTAQMISWRGFIDVLVAQGLYVISFDNRDCGLSAKLDGQHVDVGKILAAQMAGEPLPDDVPYTLSDMAADGVALLEHLGIDRAHIAGSSMGGMIVQTMAIEYPDRIASLTSIMSGPGDQRVGRPTTEARDALLAPQPADRDEYVESFMLAEVWQSKKYFDPVAVRELGAKSFDRSYYPEGATRQLAAVYASGDRSARLAALDVPTLVVHGRDDTLIKPDGGERTAELVPGARLLFVSDMGHDLPEPLWPMIAEAIGGHIRTAGVSAA
ncbi:MAG: alpha/beta hydrolase [Acidimicrobiia bacterium]|nr:alpha/beta hydrolase [Acidimicrobiia bacterium]